MFLYFFPSINDLKFCIHFDALNTFRYWSIFFDTCKNCSPPQIIVPSSNTKNHFGIFEFLRGFLPYYVELTVFSISIPIYPMVFTMHLTRTKSFFPCSLQSICDPYIPFSNLFFTILFTIFILYLFFHAFNQYSTGGFFFIQKQKDRNKITKNYHIVNSRSFFFIFL